MKTKKTNLDLILEAKEDLNGKWLVSIAAFFVAIFIIGAIPKILPDYHIGDCILAIIGGAIALGIAMFSLAIARKQHVRFMQIFDGFHNFFRAMGVYLLQTVLIATVPAMALGALFTYSYMSDLTTTNMLLAWIVGILIVIAMIVLSCMYGMSFFILADNPNIGVIEALTRSRKMMYGYKWKFFGMILWSILWVVLGMLALFVGLLFVVPVLYVAYAKFYEDIK